MARRLGIMGGTFDPIHHGHLVAADEARYHFGLDEVVFVPAGQPWQKAGMKVSPAEDRYLMCALATASVPGFSVSRVEVERPGPTYTVDTLRKLSAERPEEELYFITGADAILSILTWKDPEEVLGLARFVAVTRPGYDLSRLSEVLRRDGRVSVLEVPALAISSSEIRQRVREGRPYRFLVPREVAAYIENRGLYRE